MTQTDLLIIGAGPAGCSAAIYGVRAGLKTIIAFYWVFAAFVPALLWPAQ